MEREIEHSSCPEAYRLKDKIGSKNTCSMESIEQRWEILYFT